MQRLLIVVLALALAACATPSATDSSTAQKPSEEKEYRTGSRIPVRDPVSSSPTTTASPSVLQPAAPPRM
jgi:hypothetical protein